MLAAKRWRTGLVLVLAAATLAAVLLGYSWWNKTQPMRDLSAAVEASNLAAEDKALLTRLAWSRSAWETDLFKDIAGPVFKRVAWQKRHTNKQGRVVHIILLDSYVKPVASASCPLICIVTDEHHELLFWESVAPYSVGFVSASMSQVGNLDVLRITTFANWFRGTGTYTYEILKDRLIPVGEPEYESRKDIPRGGRPFAIDRKGLPTTQHCEILRSSTYPIFHSISKTRSPTTSWSSQKIFSTGRFQSDFSHGLHN